MLRRNQKDIQSKSLIASENAAPGFFAWPMGILKRIAGTLGVSEEPAVIVQAAETEQQASETQEQASETEKYVERPELPARSIVFSDTDNDVKSVKNTLRFAGILNEDDQFTENVEGVTIFHTGDLIDKKNPDPAAVEYWQRLQQEAMRKGGIVKFIVGNHEQEIWQKIRTGDKVGRAWSQSHVLNDFIENMELFHVAGHVLFIHGYPTLEFLQTLLHFKEVTGKDLNCFNTDHYKKAFRSVNAMKQYAYVREKRQANYLLYDVANASRYYKKHGRAVGAVLAQMEIDTVVHGHRPQRSGLQVDYEFGKWIPKVRMIGNDTMVRRKGIGGTVIRATSGETLDIVFINTKNKSNKLRRKIQSYFLEPPISSRGSCFINSGTAPERRSTARRAS